MKSKFSPQRRLFLATTAQQMSLCAASQLFSLKAFAQSAQPKKNLVCIYFLHSGNILASKNNGFERGSFHFGEGSSLTSMSQVKDQAIFIRGVDQGVSGRNAGGRQHRHNAGSVFTGHLIDDNSLKAEDLIGRDADSGTSIDIVIGKHLKKLYPKTQLPYVVLSQGGSPDERVN